MGNILAQDSLTLYSIQDGADGKSAITALLTNESHVIPCDKNGSNGNYTGANSTMMIYEGSVDVSSSWTVTATASTGITGSLSGRTYTITGISADSGYVDFTAKRNGYSNVTKRFNVTRTKVGATGSTGSAGQSATAYWMIVSASAIGKNQSGVFTPSTITLTGKTQTGTGAVSDYSGRFRFFINGNSTAAYTSAKDESTTTFTVPSGTTTLRCVMYQAGGVSVILDEQTVPVVTDGKNGTNGTNGTNGKTYILNIINGTRGVIYNASGTSPVPAMSAFSCELYENGTKVTPASYSWSVPSSNSLLSGAATTASFTPTISGTFDGSKGNNTINLSVTYAGQTIRDSVTIAATKIGNTGAQGQVGPSGSNGSNGKTYILNITGGKTTVIYNASGASPTPSGLGTFTAELYENGTKITSGISYTWSVPTANTVLSAPSASNTATYTPGLLASGFNQSTHYDNTISLTVTYAGQTIKDVQPIAVSRIGNTGGTGATGASAVAALLSNESHTFSANSSGQAISTTVSTAVYAYSGTTQITTKIGTISGLPTGMTASIVDNETTKTTITFTVTSSLTTLSGVVNIPITANGLTFNKQFSYALSKQGATGATGSTGAAAKSIDITASSQVFKSTDGGVTFSPDTIKLSPIFQGGISYSKWQYSINGGTSWVDVSSGSNGLTIASGVLTVAKTCSLFTNTISTISFKCISNNASYFDIMSILKLYDVTDIHLATRNLLLNSGVQITNSSYLAQQYSTSSLTTNSKYTIVLKGKITSPNKFGVWCNNGSNNVGYFSVGQNNAVEYFSFTTPSTLSTTTISIYNYPSSSAASATIYWAALYEGDVIPSLDWTPAPEDVDNSFTEIRDSISGVSSKVDAVENKITNKVWQSDITDKINNYNNTTIKTLTDRVTKTETDITGIRSTVSEVQTTVSKKADNTTVTELTNRVSTAEQSIDGFKTIVSDTYATKTELTGSTDSLITEISNVTEWIIGDNGISTRISSLETKTDSMGNEIIEECKTLITESSQNWRIDFENNGANVGYTDISKSGVVVKSSDNLKYTAQITGGKFSGYYNDGTMEGLGEEVFTMNEDLIKTKRVYAERGVDFNSLKLIPAKNGNYAGFVFVKSGGDA